MSLGWLFLAAMIVAYGVANLLQSIGVNRVNVHESLNPHLFVRLAGHRTYVCGLFLQFVGFLLAFLARRDLPLFLVQASSAAGLGVTVLLGIVLLRWRLVAAELGLLAMLSVGIAGQILAAEPGPARPIGWPGVLVLCAALGAIGALGLLAARMHGVPGSVVLGSLAGLSFGAAAIASRPLASTGSTQHLLQSPLLYLLIVHSILAQLLLGMAMQRGSTTAAVASMDAASAIPAAVIGVLFLGDKILSGREWLATTGFLLTLLAVLGLTRYAKPQPRRVAAGRTGPLHAMQVPPTGRSERC